MNFTVDWQPEADDSLIDIWTSASDQLAVTTAANAIERILAVDPFGYGQYLSEGLWRIRVPPLVAHYTIDPARRLVQITDISRTV
ncbi:MAG: hypothetical protein L0241_30055 [Planctomycetia bacterium]|nr:hypothetical protein [Planctomycetia bacterium]